MNTKPDISPEGVELSRTLDLFQNNAIDLTKVAATCIRLAPIVISQLTEAQAKLASARDDALEEAAALTWHKLMEWCKVTGVAPSTRDGLFKICDDIRALKSTTPQPTDTRERDLRLIKYARTGPWKPDVAVQVDENILAQFIKQDQSHDK